MLWRPMLLSCCGYFFLCSCLATSLLLDTFSNAKTKSDQTSRTTTWSSKSRFLTVEAMSHRSATVDQDDENVNYSNHEVKRIDVDRRPYQQRAKGPRVARRLNHAFKYLYRHDATSAYGGSGGDDDDDDEITLIQDNNYNTNNNNNNDNNDEYHADNGVTAIQSNQHKISSREFLRQYGGFTNEEIDTMSHNFPPLLDLDVQRHLKPKLRFLQETILQNGPILANSLWDQHPRHNQPTALPEILRRGLPAQYFGARLERTLAPRHAFLVYQNLPHGRQLLSTTITTTTTSSLSNHDNHDDRSIIMWQDFLLSCRHPKRFAALCNRWRQQQQHQLQQLQQQVRDHHNNPIHNHHNNNHMVTITSKQVEAFDAIFARGLMAAARNELYQSSLDDDSNNQTIKWQLNYINVTSAEMIQLLIQHGANPLERDIRGVTLLHWAAGTGNLEAVQVLLSYFPQGVWTQAERDGALALHWAAAGAKAREFGCGGHPIICQFLLDHAASVSTVAKTIPKTTTSNHHNDNSMTMMTDAKKSLVNTVTKDGNSPLMWAAWSGTLETVKLFIRNRADVTVQNRNGCTVAHWAASGGNVAVCQYLANICNVDFSLPNHGGNTPLTHAVAFGRVDVVDWLRQYHHHLDKTAVILDNDGDPFADRMAVQLARDFVTWTNGEVKRQKILHLMSDWLGIQGDDSDDDDYDDDTVMATTLPDLEDIDSY